MSASIESQACSFCGIEQDRAEQLFLGDGVAICDVCVEACRQPLDARGHVTLEPEATAAALMAEFGWGPLNCGAAIRANFCCEYCGAGMLRSLANYYSWQMDHITPVRDDSLENYALACGPCNHLKHNYVPMGTTRSERLADAKREVSKRRGVKFAELQSLRKILGLPILIEQ